MSLEVTLRFEVSDDLPVSDVLVEASSIGEGTFGVPVDWIFRGAGVLNIPCEPGDAVVGN